MSEEIKEILKKTDIDAVSYGVIINYITNLQKENKELLKKTYKDDVIITKTIETLKTLKGSARWERHMYEIDYLINILKGE